MARERPLTPPPRRTQTGRQACEEYQELSSRDRHYLIDGVQYARWSAAIFQEMREGGVDAVHATVAYHGDCREARKGIADWSRRFKAFSDLILHGKTGSDIARAHDLGRTAVFLGFQNPSPIGDDLSLVETFHGLGIRFMQLTYNNQSLLGSGYLETRDAGVTRMGRQVIAEMNRLGMVIDMSHSGEISTLDAMSISERPVAISHANPKWWHDTPRNISDAVMRAVSGTGGMIGFSIYPHHLRSGSNCRLESFCEMIAESAERYGIDSLGLGSDLCQGQPASVLAWMRYGRWSRRPKSEVVGKGYESFPSNPVWFRDNRDFGNVAEGLTKAGFADMEVAKILGENWKRFLEESLGATP